MAAFRRLSGKSGRGIPLKLNIHHIFIKFVGIIFSIVQWKRKESYSFLKK